MSFPSFTCNFVGVSIDTRRRFRRLELDDLSPPWSSFSRLLLLSDSAFPMDGLSPCSHCMTVCTVMRAFSLEPSLCRLSSSSCPADFSRSFVVFISPLRCRYTTKRCTIQIYPSFYSSVIRISLQRCIMSLTSPSSSTCNLCTVIGFFDSISAIFVHIFNSNPACHHPLLLTSTSTYPLIHFPLSTFHTSVYCYRSLIIPRDSLRSFPIDLSH
jgi:hypothetical protein